MHLGLLKLHTPPDETVQNGIKIVPEVPSINTSPGSHGFGSKQPLEDPPDDPPEEPPEDEGHPVHLH